MTCILYDTRCKFLDSYVVHCRCEYTNIDTLMKTKDETGDKGHLILPSIYPYFGDPV